MEFMPKGSLYELIHLSHTPPSWFHRALLSLQIACAILSLHEALPCRLIHRDIKSTNILLDSKNNAKLSDFGLAVKKDSDNQFDDQALMPAGTIGYIDPCYTESGQLGPESDVYSFGVLLLEIISSRKVFDLDSDPSCIVSFAVPLIDGDDLYEICDRRISLCSDLERYLVMRILDVARRCVSEKIEKRPLMKEVVEEFQRVVEKISWPFLLPIGVRVSCCVYKCVRIWKRCVRKRVMTTKIVCKEHLMVGNGGGIDDCGNDVDLKLG
ncbi:hypothetical protein LUZ60_003987 [Juncus effusus]|nr:hypothetical protein LUZ60_003987 [Juncus effusus]